MHVVPLTPTLLLETYQSAHRACRAEDIMQDMQDMEPTIESTTEAIATPDAHEGRYQVPGTSFGSVKTLAVGLVAQLALAASVLTATI